MDEVKQTENAAAADAEPAPVHRMRLAKMSYKIGKRLGYDHNNFARVWCDCMDSPVYGIGEYSSRPVYEVQNDPRRLGSFDALGVVDLREQGSALRLWKEHVNG